MQHVSKLDDRVRKLREDWEKERASMRRVELEWDAELVARLSELGAIRVSSVRDYKEIENPVMVAGKHIKKISESAGMFYYPHSIAIHPKTSNVYVCDSWNNRVQVFTKSLKFLFDFSVRVFYLDGIYISNNSVYVTQYSTPSLIRTSLVRTLANPNTTFLQSEHPKYNIFRFYALNQRL